MKISPDELTLQKCADGELSDAERAALLANLHHAESIDHWRTLALTFVENQVFAKAFETPLAANPPEELPPRPLPPVMKRQLQPWVSVAASLLVGALMGVGGHFWLRDSSDAGSQLAETRFDASKSPLNSEAGFSPSSVASVVHPPENSIASPKAGQFSPPVRLASDGNMPSPVMNVKVGAGHSGDQALTVPVYSPEQWHSVPNAGNLTNIPEDVQRMLESEGYQLERKRYWYRARLKDGREVMVPAEKVIVRPVEY
ncbi:hypothetical protein [Planctomicrobium sp. SH527]|uniref:hypothetical protein n=1 Tax=Planctomicrobium sp. SH527 TaxID=3448123 RepID=UPI003F5C77DC